jgi:hypothetical protein
MTNIRHYIDLVESAGREGADDDRRWQPREIALKDGRTTVIHAFDDWEENCITVYATIGDVTVAEGKFDPERNYFRGIEVSPTFRRIGLATAIYDYIDSQGYHIQPSNNVQPDGQKFWASRRNRS